MVLGEYDVAVIGGGHAGCEAALAAASTSSSSAPCLPRRMFSITVSSNSTTS